MRAQVNAAKRTRAAECAGRGQRLQASPHWLLRRLHARVWRLRAAGRYRRRPILVGRGVAAAPRGRWRGAVRRCRDPDASVWTRALHACRHGSILRRPLAGCRRSEGRGGGCRPGAELSSVRRVPERLCALSVSRALALDASIWTARDERTTGWQRERSVPSEIDFFSLCAPSIHTHHPTRAPTCAIFGTLSPRFSSKFANNRGLAPGLLKQGTTASLANHAALLLPFFRFLLLSLLPQSSHRIEQPRATPMRGVCHLRPPR
jgi:hypothetical protein